MQYCVLWCSALLAAAVAASSKQYNVLYFIVDDLRPEFMAAYGQSQMLTPNVDKLANSGTVFANAHCQQAVCGPSRASFMTGRRPQHTRVYDNEANFRHVGLDSAGVAGSDWTTCPGHFKQSNFTTLGGGKTFHPKHPLNWDGDQSWGNKQAGLPYYDFAYYKPNPAYSGPCPGPGAPSGAGASKIDTWCALDEPDENFYDHGLASNTIKQLQYAAQIYKKHQKPFFIQAGFARPHAPWRVPQRFWDMYNSSNIKLAKHKLPPTDMPGIAYQQDGFYNATTGEVYHPTITTPIADTVAIEMRHAYYAAVSWTDFQIGRVLDELTSLELADQTLVLMHGDHGWQLGEHNSWHKFTNFELGTRVPLIIRAPWKTKSIGANVKIFAELIDLYPTISELSGAPAPHDQLDGVSLAPVFSDPSLLALKDAATLNKSVAYSQFPHHSDYGCEWFRQGKCFNTSASDVPANMFTSNPRHPTDVKMGFRVRDHSFSFCVWLGWDSDKEAAVWPDQIDSSSLVELYNHTTDDGTDFDSMDVANLAYQADAWASTQKMYRVAKDFFGQPSPPGPPSPTKVCTAAGGILAADDIACCARSCGQCGGKGCPKLPGGKDNCCSGQVKSNGKNCATSKAPCSVH